MESRQLRDKCLASQLAALPPAESASCFSWQFGVHQTIIFPALFVAVACSRRVLFVIRNRRLAFLAACCAFSCDPTLSYRRFWFQPWSSVRLYIIGSSSRRVSTT